MQPLAIIRKYYDEESVAFRILTVHSELVQAKALALARRVQHLQPDEEFIREAAMLHDIGIFLTNAPGIGCHGEAPYIMHGPLGRDLLEKEGLPRHALVCDRHTGVGLSLEEIIAQDLPLPHREMLPISLEEKSICFADCFYGKNPDKLRQEKSISKIEKNMARFGESNLQRLRDLRVLFGL